MNCGMHVRATDWEFRLSVWRQGNLRQRLLPLVRFTSFRIWQVPEPFFRLLLWMWLRVRIELHHGPRFWERHQSIDDTDKRVISGQGLWRVAHMD